MATDLQRLAIVSPGKKGLYTQRAVDLNDPQAAKEALNCVYDENDRIAARKGFTVVSASPTNGDIEQIFEAEFDKDTRIILTTLEGAGGVDKIMQGTTTLDIVSPVGDPYTASNWKFQNFNGLVIGIQQGHQLIQWDGGAGRFSNIQSNVTQWAPTTATAVGDVVRPTGTPSNIILVCTAVSGSTNTGASEPTWSDVDFTLNADGPNVTWQTIVMPAGNDVLAAFGRLWAFTEDGQTLKYSGILQEQGWGLVNGGFIDLNYYWASNSDYGVALAEFNNLLVVFGRHSVILLVGAADPSTMTVNDSLRGIGCKARDSVQNVGTDLIFLDDTGLRSLLRSLELKTQPLREVSKNVRDDFILSVEQANLSKIRSVYNPEDGFYLMKVGEDFWYFDTKFPLEDGSARVLKWDSLPAGCFCWSTDEQRMYFGGIGALQGEVGFYSGYNDGTATYTVDFETIFLDFQTPLLKVLKKCLVKLVGGSGYTYTLKWKKDYNEEEYVRNFALPTLVRSEWGTAEYNIGEYAGDDPGLTNNPVMLTQTGQHISVGLRVQVNGLNIAIRELDILFKQGRLDR